MPRDGTLYCLDPESSFTHLTKIYRPVRGRKPFLSKATRMLTDKPQYRGQKARALGGQTRSPESYIQHPALPPVFSSKLHKAKPFSHTLHHSGEPQPSIRQHDPLQNQWEERRAYGWGTQSCKPTEGGIA